MNQKERLFFELLQVAIGTRNRLPSTPTLEEWEEIQNLCKKQTMVGIGFVEMKRLPQEQWPQEHRFIMRWTKRSGLSGYGDFFGDSRATDMISDKGEQLSDYFDIELTISYKSNNKRYSIQRRR